MFGESGIWNNWTSTCSRSEVSLWSGLRKCCEMNDCFEYVLMSNAFAQLINSFSFDTTSWLYILFTGFSFVRVRGKRCIQFTDDRDGTNYALKVINGTNVIFEVIYIKITKQQFTGKIYYIRSRSDVIFYLFIFFFLAKSPKLQEILKPLTKVVIFYSML